MIKTILVVLITAVLTAWFISTQFGGERFSFTSENAQVRFLSYATQISPSRRLQLAQIEQVEHFERKSEARLLWDRIPLPDVAVSATVPVEYNYYVSLEDAWEFNLTESHLTIIAPSLTPGTPAPNISELRFRVEEGSVLRSERSVARQLQSEITEMLKERALENKALIRELSRQELMELASLWLKSEGLLNVDTTILFKDEVSEALDHTESVHINQ